MPKKKINIIALEVRLIIETFRESAPENKWGFRMGGACATASVLIGAELKRQGISYKILEGREKRTRFDHVWIETEDYLIDVTYDQFDLKNPKILITLLGSKEYASYRKKFNVPKNRKTIKDFLSWNVKQRPSSCIIKMKKMGILSNEFDGLNQGK